MSEAISLNVEDVKTWRSIITLVVFVLTSKSRTTASSHSTEEVPRLVPLTDAHLSYCRYCRALPLSYFAIRANVAGSRVAHFSGKVASDL